MNDLCECGHPKEDHNFLMGCNHLGDQGEEACPCCNDPDTFAREELAELSDLRTLVSELESENITMYAAIIEAAELGNNAARRCKVELQRIARKDAAK